LRKYVVKMPKSGVGFQCLDEREVTLKGTLAKLGLRPLTKKAEREMHKRLGFALAKWDEPYVHTKVHEVVGSLKSHAKRLEKTAPVTAVAKGGICRNEDIDVTCQLAQSLGEEPTIGSLEAAYAYLADFGERAAVIANASRMAATRLQPIKGKGGGSAYVWYDEFTAVLLDLCKKNKIEPEARIDRTSGEPVGGLAKVASGFERLLPPNMRSSTPGAMVKRLQRSLGRLTNARPLRQQRRRIAKSEAN
jgi:hypothetical protein